MVQKTFLRRFITIQAVVGDKTEPEVITIDTGDKNYRSVSSIQKALNEQGQQVKVLSIISSGVNHITYSMSDEDFIHHATNPSAPMKEEK